MIRRFAQSALAVLVGCAVVTPVLASPQDDLTAAAKKLADAPNYSWKTEVENAGGGGGGRGGPGASEGQAQKDGLTHVTMTRGQNTIEAFFNGKKCAIKAGDDWKSLEEATADDGNAGGGGGRRNPARMAARMMQNFKGPAEEAVMVAGDVKDLKDSDGALEGALNEETAKKMLAFGGGRRGGGGNADANAGPQVSGAKGTAKFWIKDGTLAKVEYNVQGTVSFNGNDRDINRKTTVEIKDVGTTKIDVPDGAKKKME